MFHSKLKLKRISVMTAFSFLLISMSAKAGVESDMADMFNSMGARANYTQGGAYHSQSASIYTGGGFSARFGNKTLYPVQIQMPSVNAGCGGIDFFSGAFSFANKEQFVEFTRNLGNNAAGVAFEIALDSLDPLIGGAISKIRDVVNFINQNGLNSCQAAKALVGGAAGKLAESVGKECELTTNADGTVSDHAEGRWYCKSKARMLNQRTKKLNEALGDFYSGSGNIVDGDGFQWPQGAGKVNKTSMAMTGGNVTLMALNSFNLNAEQKQWMMSIIGVGLFSKPPKSSDSNEDVTPEWKYLPPTITAEAKADPLFDFFASNSSDKIRLTLWNCHEPGSSSATDPYKATECTQETKEYFGFRKQAADQIAILKSNIRTGTRASTTDQAKIAQIIENTSYPLLRMALVDERMNSSYLTDKAVEAITLDLSHAYLARLAKAAQLAMGNFKAQNEDEEKMVKNGFDSLNRLMDNLKRESDAAKQRVSNEQNFGEYVKKVNNALSGAFPDVSSSLTFSRIVSSPGVR